MKTIVTAAITLFHNGEHLNFENAVLGVLTPSLAAGLNLTEQRAQLQQAHDKEEEIYLTNQTYRQTQTLAQLDASRDRKFGDIKATVAFYRRMGNDAQKAAAEAVNFVLKPFRQAPAKGYMDNTAELDKFVTDMSVRPFPAHIAMLGLTGTLAGLKADNDAFTTVYEARAEEGLNRVGHEKIRALRRQFDEAWRIVAIVLPGAHFVEPDAAKKAAIGKAIDEINAHILQTKKTLAARRSRSAHQNHPGDNGGDSPRDGYADDADERKQLNH